ncbi:putative phage abortive infection protein [Priestia koreensis]|uniref:putative phage abortive infection protein n=1 Tax=Priestia koreensis TaxID=284581 RepID=UPI00203FA194|nr:putative phage abortive infection protein [Priestia koreensis]MCM3005874.1 putative phage abortive infection protein [Priestia koreensis]
MKLKKRTEIILILTALLALLIPLSVGLYSTQKLSIGFDKMGPFGDFLAGTTVPTLTLISIIFLYKTLKLQQKQIEDQRLAAENQKKDSEQNRELINIQQFESTFFNFLNLYHQNLSSIEVVGKKDIDFFEEFIEKFQECYKILYLKQGDDKTYKNDNIFLTEKEYINRIQKTFELLPLKYKSSMMSYNKNLYYLITFIDESTTIKYENNAKQKYIRIVRSQLSLFEMYSLFLYTVGSGKKNFIKLINKYRLLRSLEMDIMNQKFPEVKIPPSDLLSYYESSLIKKK